MIRDKDILQKQAKNNSVEALKLMKEETSHAPSSGKIPFENPAFV